MTFACLQQKWGWKPIPNCPGRYVLSRDSFSGPPEELVGPAVDLHHFRVKAARDPVVVSPLETGGVISFRRADGTYIHTLNTAEGFERKLAQLGIRL